MPPPRRPPLLLLLLLHPLLILLLLQPSAFCTQTTPPAASCSTGNIYFDTAGLFAQACPEKIAHGEYCRFDDTYCQHLDIMVKSYVCNNGTLYWAEPFDVCPQWAFCRVSADRHTLVCDGRQGTTADLFYTFFNYDPRLQDISFVHIPSLLRVRDVTFLDKSGGQVRRLNLSSNAIQSFKVRALYGLRNLQSLDLSHNALTQLSENELSCWGKLEHFDAGSNPLVSASPYSLHAGLERCYYGLGGGNNNSDPGDNSTTLQLPTVSLRLQNSSESCAMVTSQVNSSTVCQRLQCPADFVYQPAVYWPCDAFSDVSGGPNVQQLPIYHLCDGVRDCQDERFDDEAYCASLLKATSVNGTAIECDSLALLADRYSIRNGLFFFHISPSYTVYFSDPIVTIPLTAAGGNLTSKGSPPIVKGSIHRQGSTLRIQAHVSNPNLNSNFSCTVIYDLGPKTESTAALEPGVTSTSTTFSPSQPGAQASTRATPTTAIAVAVPLVAAAVIIVLVVGIILRRTQRARRDTVLKFATPSHCLAQAKEKFHLQFAEAMGGQQRCDKLYAAANVQVGQVQLQADHVLGTGQFGVVVVGTFKAPSRHPAWSYLHQETVLPTQATENASLGSRQPMMAVKLVKSQEEGALTQFLLEARLLAVMAHPNVVRLLAVQDAYLPLMLIMEYCEGGDLRRYLRNATPCPSVAALLDMANQVAAAVEYLHAALCVHRDLAARNVLLTQRHARGQALPLCGYVLKLADLGLARGLASNTDYYRVG